MRGGGSVTWGVWGGSSELGPGPQSELRAAERLQYPARPRPGGRREGGGVGARVWRYPYALASDSAPVRDPPGVYDQAATASGPAHAARSVHAGRVHLPVL